MSDLDKISSIFNAKIDSVKTKDDLQNIKTEFFGKNGQITQQFKSLGSLDPEKRKEFASNLNKIKDDLTNQLEQKNIEIETNEINEKLKTKSSAKKRFRFTASGKIKMPQAGKRHGMIKRTNSQIRKQRGTTIMTKQDSKIVKSYMPYNLRG